MERYAIIENYTEYVPGDERSRTNPGHGYPAHTVNHKTIREFKTKEEWEKWIKENLNPQYGMKREFTPIVFRVAEVKQSVSISID